MAQERRDLYSILQVHRDADPEIIDAAFHALAEKYQLGPDSSSEAAERLQDMQAAYTVLADPHLRSLYDRLLDGAATSSEDDLRAELEASGLSAEAAGAEARLACQICGRIGPSLRYATFTWTGGSPLHPSSRVSTLLLCDSHRRRRGLAYGILAAAMGVLTGWRQPSGRPPSAARNLHGGSLPAYSNARLLRRLALEYLAKQDIANAATCLRLSLEFQPNGAVEHLLDRIGTLADGKRGPAGGRPDAKPSLRPLVGTGIVLASLLMAVVAMWGLLESTRPTLPVAAARSGDPLRSPLPGAMVVAQPNDTPFRADAFYLSLVRLLDRLALAADEYSTQVQGIDTFAEAQDSPAFIRASRAFGDQLMTLVDDLTALGAAPQELAEFRRLTEDLLVLRAAIAFDFTIAARTGDEVRWRETIARQDEFNRTLRQWEEASKALQGGPQ